MTGPAERSLLLPLRGRAAPVPPGGTDTARQMRGGGRAQKRYSACSWLAIPPASLPAAGPGALVWAPEPTSEAALLRLSRRPTARVARISAILLPLAGLANSFLRPARRGAMNLWSAPHCARLSNGAG